MLKPSCLSRPTAGLLIATLKWGAFYRGKGSLQTKLGGDLGVSPSGALRAPPSVGIPPQTPAAHLPDASRAPPEVKGHCFLSSILLFGRRGCLRSIARINTSVFGRAAVLPPPEEDRQKSPLPPAEPMDIAGPSPGKESKEPGLKSICSDEP